MTEATRPAPRGMMTRGVLHVSSSRMIDRKRLEIDALEVLDGIRE